MFVLALWVLVGFFFQWNTLRLAFCEGVLKQMLSVLREMTSEFILETGDFRVFNKADPFPRDVTWKENRVGGKVMRERFFPL